MSGEEALRKELATVKKKAVEKIRTLNAQVETLEKKLLEKARVSPPESASSDVSDSGDRERFIKVESPRGDAAAAEQRAALELREQAVTQRERALAAREAAAASGRAGAAAARAAAWHAKLLDGLRELNDNVEQIELAAAVAGG